MSGITSFFALPVDTALIFKWTVNNTLINVANIKAIKVYITDTFRSSSDNSSRIMTTHVIPILDYDQDLNVIGIQKQYIYNGLINGRDYLAVLEIVTDSATYNSGPSITKHPGTVPAKPTFKYVPVDQGFTFTLTRYQPNRTVDDGYYQITNIKAFLGDGTVLTVTDYTDVQYNSSYDDTYTFSGLTNGTPYEFAIVTSNEVGDSIISETVVIIPGTSVQAVSQVGIATIEYNRYQSEFTSPDEFGLYPYADASTATILFNPALNTSALLANNIPVISYDIYRQDVLSDGTTLVPNTKIFVGSILLDSNGDSLTPSLSYDYNESNYVFKFEDTVAGIVLGNYYSYTVIGINDAGSGVESENSIVRIGSKPGAPTVLVTPGDESVTLNITPGTLNGYPMVNSNGSYWIDISGIHQSVVTDASGNVTLTKTGGVYNFSTLTNSTLNVITVFTQTENATPITESQVYTGFPTTVTSTYGEPSDVRNLNFTIASQTINLTWTIPLSIGGAGSNGNGPLLYRVVIDASNADSSANVIDQSGITSTSFSTSGLVIDNKQYTAIVYAYFVGPDGTIYSSPGVRINNIVPNPPSEDVSNLTATPGDHKVTLNWTNNINQALYPTVKIAIYKSTNGGAYSLYHVDGSSAVQFVDASGAAIVSSTYVDTDTGLSAANNAIATTADVYNGYTYSYKVIALHNQGAQQPSGVIASTMPFGKPIVKTIVYQPISTSYNITISKNGSNLQEYLLVGVDASGTDIPVYNSTIPSGVTYTGAIDNTNYVAANNTYVLNIPVAKAYAAELFIVQNAAGMTPATKGVFPTGINLP